MKSYATACIVFLGVTAQVCAQPLPLADGKYVDDQSLCPLTQVQIAEKYTDFADSKVYTIKGKEIGGAYERGCTVKSAKLKGSTIAISGVCHTEGEVEPLKEKWEMLSSDAFRTRGQSYRRCKTARW